MAAIVVALVLLFAGVGLFLMKLAMAEEKEEPGQELIIEEFEGEWPCAPYVETQEAKEERIRLEVAAAMDEFGSSRRTYAPGTCIVCGEKFPLVDDRLIDMFCGIHMMAGFKHLGVQIETESEQAAA